MLDDLRALAVFARVAQSGSFRAAARALALSPSVVSHHVRSLEERIGQPLLYRTTRRVALTPDGEALFSAARDMVEAAERGLDAAGGRSAMPSGTLRLTVPAFLGDTAFPRDLAAFALAFPRVRLTISIGDAPRDLLRDGFDLALRVGELADSSHVARLLATMPRLLLASPRYLKTRKAPATARDLADWDLVHLSPRPPVISLVPPGGQRPVSIGLTPRASVDSAAAACDLVVAGVGIATLPEVIARRALARGQLVELLPRFTVPPVDVHAVWPATSRRPTLTRSFVEFIAPRVAELFKPPRRIDAAR